MLFLFDLYHMKHHTTYYLVRMIEPLYSRQSSATIFFLSSPIQNAWKLTTGFLELLEIIGGILYNTIPLEEGLLL